MAKEKEIYEFQWGDRVDHNKFGLGTVNGEPRAASGSSENGPGLESKGHIVPVQWDDETRTASAVTSSFLKLVDRPNAKGGAYWRAEYSKLANEVMSARRAVDVAVSNGFRPIDGKGMSHLRAAIAVEKEQLSALLAFLENDERGEHA